MSNSDSKPWQQIVWRTPRRSATARLKTLGGNFLAMFGAAPKADRTSLQAIVESFGDPSIPGSPLNEAQQLLLAAGEIEHALLVEYLYTAWSAAPNPAGGQILQIAVQEMCHLITVQNLLLFVGINPSMSRQDQDAAPKLDPFPFALRPFSREVLVDFLLAEMPPLKDMTPDQRAVMQPIVDSRPTQSAVHPVGVLYAKLYWLFQADDSATQPWPEIAALGFDPDRHVADFPGEASSTTFQVDPEAEPYWKSGDGRGGIFKKISSRAAALQALFAIASQGEGLAGANDQQSHFAKFLDIFSNTDFSQLPAKWPTDPFLSDQVDADPTREANRIGNPTAAALCRVFDLRYQILLTSIRAALSRNRTSPAEVAVRMKYVGWAFEEMVSSIKHLAKFIAKLPRKAALGAGQPVAAPTFALDNLSIPDTAAELDRKLADLHRLAAAAIDDALGKGVEAGARLVLSGMRTNDKLRFPELPDVIA